MKLLSRACVVLVVGLCLGLPGFAAAQLERRPLPPTSPAPPARAPSVVSPGWPIHRPLNPVIVRPGRDERRFDDRRREDRRRDDRSWDDRRRDEGRRGRHRVAPLRFLPLVIFGGVLVDGRDRRSRLLWEDSTTIYDDEEWVEFTLDCGTSGDRLWIELRDGRGRIDWAEIVFEDGESQVIDFSDRSLGPGLYRLIDFRGERRVDHVRLVARASTRELRLILRMER